MPRAWLAFERANNVRGYPAAVELPGLWLNAFPVHRTGNASGIKRNVIPQPIIARAWPGIVPGDGRLGLPRKGPVASGTFPLAHGAAARFDEIAPIHVNGWQVKSRWTRRFHQTQAAAAPRDQRIAIPDLDKAIALLQRRRPRVIPDRFLFGLWRNRKLGSLLSLVIPHDGDGIPDSRNPQPRRPGLEHADV